MPPGRWGKRSGRAGAAATAKAGELEPADEAFAHHGGAPLTAQKEEAHE